MRKPAPDNLPECVALVILLSVQAISGGNKGCDIVIPAHALALVRQVPDYVAVLGHGRSVEQGNTDRIFDFSPAAATNTLIAVHAEL